MKKLKEFFGGHAASGPVEYLVVGLGNPGKQYAFTRHNAGYLAVDHISAKLGFAVNRLKFKSLCGDAVISGKRVLFLKPTTFMNNSGEAVRDAMQFYKLPIENVLVIFDDASLPVGAMRIRQQGSDGGQKGARSIIYLTGKDTFPRVKIGIGAKAHPEMDMADWVLSAFTKQDAAALEPVWDRVLEAVEMMVKGDIAGAMNKFN